MKIFLWDVCDTLHNYLRKHQSLFVGDVSEGCLLECGFCGHEYVDNVDNCPECGGDVIYPRADW